MIEFVHYFRLVKVWDLRKTHTANKHDPIAKLSFAHPKKGKSNKIGMQSLIYRSQPCGGGRGHY